MNALWQAEAKSNRAFSSRWQPVTSGGNPVSGSIADEGARSRPLVSACAWEGPISPAATPTRRALEMALPPTMEATLNTRGGTQPAPPPRQLDPHAPRPAHDGGRSPVRYADRCLTPRVLRHGRPYTDAVIARDGCVRRRWQQLLSDGLALQPLLPPCATRRQRPEAIWLVVARRLNFQDNLSHTSTRTTVDSPVA